MGQRRAILQHRLLLSASWGKMLGFRLAFAVRASSRMVVPLLSCQTAAALPLMLRVQHGRRYGVGSAADAHLLIGGSEL